MWRSLLLLILLPVALWAGPADVPVLFSNTTNTVPGQSLFVLGNIPQLGEWDPVRAVKLVPSNCNLATCQWAAVIGIPAGTSYEYKFVKRDDCALCYSNAANILYESGANRTGSVPAGPPAPWPGKTIFYYSGWSSVSILYSNTATSNFVAQAMVPVSNGLWRADGLNQAGELNLVFLFTDNLGHYDNPDLIPNNNYATPLDACVVRNGQVYNYWPPAFVSTNRVETFSITPNNGLPGRTIRVYLPRGYNENTMKRYPVLYMHDGQNLFLNMGQFGSWHADTNANNLIRFGRMRETIIVGVDNSNERLREYTPPGCTPPFGGTSLGAQYTDFLINQLKPLIDATYRTLTNADNTGVAGSSMGGLISAHLGWEQSLTFHKIGAFSSSFQVCQPITVATKRPIRIYLDSGNKDTSMSTLEADTDGLLDTFSERDKLIVDGYVFNNDLDHTIGYGHWHNEQWWDVRSPRCFTFLFPTSDEPNTVLPAPRITNFQLAGPSNLVTWTSYRLRSYAVEGATNPSFISGMTWSNLATLPAETRPWNYPTLGVTNAFYFLRVRENAVPDWPN
ncbi:MAG: alpha/beta hydrolase-fold protein [Verrucomicrobiota bacterium]